MRLLQFNAKTNQWVQLFADSALDKYKNLSDLTDLVAARRNLELDKYYWNKDALKTGSAIEAIHPICIIQDKDNRFVTDNDIKNWNQKVDRPVISSSEKDITLTEGQIIYNPATDVAQIMLNGSLQSLKLGALTGAITGSSTFVGEGNERVIEHGATTMKGTPIVPKSVIFNPASNPKGKLGETWVRYDDTNIYIGNTGSFTGTFNYTIFY